MNRFTCWLSFASRHATYRSRPPEGMREAHLRRRRDGRPRKPGRGIRTRPGKQPSEKTATGKGCQTRKRVPASESLGGRTLATTLAGRPVEGSSKSEPTAPMTAAGAARSGVVEATTVFGFSWPVEQPLEIIAAPFVQHAGAWPIVPLRPHPVRIAQAEVTHAACAAIGVNTVSATSNTMMVRATMSMRLLKRPSGRFPTLRTVSDAMPVPDIPRGALIGLALPHPFGALSLESRHDSIPSECRDQADEVAGGHLAAPPSVSPPEPALG
jgi:hypothetical protein